MALVEAHADRDRVEVDRIVYGAWHTERFAREKKLKPLDHYLRHRTAGEVPPPSPEDRKTVGQAAALFLQRLVRKG